MESGYFCDPKYNPKINRAHLEGLHVIPFSWDQSKGGAMTTINAEGVSAEAVLAELRPGDLVLVGARPGQRKTLLSLEIAIEAMKAGERGLPFSLEYNEADVVRCFTAIGEHMERFRDRFEFERSDDISASVIINRFLEPPPGTVVVVDYQVRDFGAPERDTGRPTGSPGLEWP